VLYTFSSFFFILLEGIEMADTKSFFLKQIDSVLDRYAPAEMSLKRTEGSASIFNFCSAALTTISRIAGGDSYYAEQAEDFRNVQDYGLCCKKLKEEKMSMQ